MISGGRAHPNDDLFAYRERLVALGEQVAASMPPFEGAHISEHFLQPDDGAKIGVRVVKPDGQTGPLPLLMWIHGGGHVVGSAAQDDAFCVQIATAANCAVVSVDYRLAPEFPFPTPLHDCHAVLAWAFEKYADIGVDPTRIAVAGLSAGAGLAAALAQLARDRGDIPLTFQLLYYPMLDDRNIARAQDVAQDTVVWSRNKNAFAWAAYLGRTNDLSNLPTTYLMCGDLDLFLQKNLDYAKRLIAAGVPTDLHVYKGAYHSFDQFAPMSGVAMRSNADSQGALKKALHGE